MADATKYLVEMEPTLPPGPQRVVSYPSGIVPRPKWENPAVKAPKPEPVPKPPWEEDGAVLTGRADRSIAEGGEMKRRAMPVKNTQKKWLSDYIKGMSKLLVELARRAE